MDEKDEKDSEYDILTGFTHFVDNNLRVFRVSHSSVFSHASLQLLFGGTKAVESLKLKGEQKILRQKRLSCLRLRNMGTIFVGLF